MRWSKNTTGRVLKLLLKHKVGLVLSLILAIISVVTTLRIPVLIGKAIDTFLGDNSVDFKRLIEILLSMCVIMLITAISQWFLSYINGKIVYSMVKELRIESFKKIQRINLEYVDSTSKGDILNRVINDIDQFSEGLLMGLSQFITGVLTIIITLVFMFMLSKIITLVVVILTPVSMIFSSIVAKKSYIYFKEQSEKRADMTSLSEELIDGFSTVKVFSMEEEVGKNFNAVNEKLRVAGVRAIFVSALIPPSTRFINSLIYASVGIMGAMLVISGGLSVGNLISFLSYSSTYAKPFNDISGVVSELQNSFACITRVFEFIDEKDIVKDSDTAIELPDIDGNVELKDVSFSYDKTKKFIENLNINAKPGKKIAIVGPTGCGKTTVINLLMRFYEIDSGTIRVDGNNILDIKRDSLVSSYGMVLQETWLKSGTVYENIAMGKENATMEEVITAAKLANADDFIMKLKDGYNTVISEGGDNISAGQKQLLCIARVMLLLPPMLILDEATSSIDTRTELKISKAFDKLMQGRTSFIVAHRLSTIKSADLILVMQAGKIIESGNHQSLIDKQGFYAKLYQSQFEAV